MGKELTLLSWNVNGIRAVYKKGFLDWLDAAKPDILCLQETKAREDQLGFDLKSPEGYFSFFESGERPGYSGVAIYSLLEPSTVVNGMDDDFFDREGRVIMADYGDFVVFNVYFPNGKASAERLAFKMDFYNSFLELLIKMNKEGRKILICGDVNTAHTEIDLARPKENEKVSGFLPIERKWIDELILAGFKDTLRMFKTDAGLYSWWDFKTKARERNVGWRIDYWFVNDRFADSVTDAFILQDVYGSDHCPVGIKIRL
ncbi:exodeoxyribonuclease III [Candidatus Peregrinibacteria bacterium]|nr:exodeoxyribonuclease III [Candidatus Peregrinibacteria bacterium]